MPLKQTAITVLLLIFFAGTVCAQIPYDYSNWNFSYAGEYGHFTAHNESADIVLTNGTGYLTTALVEALAPGDIILLNLTYNLSPYTVFAGIKIIVGDEVVYNKQFESIASSVVAEFHVNKDHIKGEEFRIMLYSYGGNSTFTIEKLSVIVPKSGFSEGLLLSGMGITMVFFVLSILAAVMYLNTKIISKEESQTAAKKQEKQAVISKPQKIKKETVSEEEIAVITAAISAYMEGKKFRIISVKKSPWKYYGRLAMLRRRLK